MTLKERTNYQVGYGKPPIETRFQKGKSGKSEWKAEEPRSSTGYWEDLQHISNEEVSITIDGKRKLMLKAEVLFSAAIHECH